MRRDALNRITHRPERPQRSRIDTERHRLAAAQPTADVCPVDRARSQRLGTARGKGAPDCPLYRPAALAGLRGRLRKLGWCAHFIGGANTPNDIRSPGCYPRHSRSLSGPGETRPNGPPPGQVTRHREPRSPTVARAPRAAMLRPRRRAPLRTFVVRCGLPCDPPVGGHSCNGGSYHASIARSVTEADRQIASARKR